MFRAFWNWLRGPRLVDSILGIDYSQNWQGGVSRTVEVDANGVRRERVQAEFMRVTQGEPPQVLNWNSAGDVRETKICCAIVPEPN